MKLFPFSEGVRIHQTSFPALPRRNLHPPATPSGKKDPNCKGHFWAESEKGDLGGALPSGGGGGRERTSNFCHGLKQPEKVQSCARGGGERRKDAAPCKSRPARPKLCKRATAGAARKAATFAPGRGKRPHPAPLPSFLHSAPRAGEARSRPRLKRKGRREHSGKASPPFKEPKTRQARPPSPP